MAHPLESHRQAPPQPLEADACAELRDEGTSVADVLAVLPRAIKIHAGDRRVASIYEPGHSVVGVSASGRSRGGVVVVIAPQDLLEVLAEPAPTLAEALGGAGVG